jgi:hypothetical protein
MENYPITISKDKAIHYFEVGEYVHHEEDKCKYRVFENSNYVASLTPDDHDFLNICQNPGGVDEEILHLLADQIEMHHSQGVGDYIRKLKL